MRIITSLNSVAENKYYIRVSRNFFGTSYIVIRTLKNRHYEVWEFESVRDIYIYFHTVVDITNDRVRPSWKSRIKLWLKRNTGSIYEVDVHSEEDVEIFGTMSELVN